MDPTAMMPPGQARHWTWTPQWKVWTCIRSSEFSLSSSHSVLLFAYSTQSSGMYTCKLGGQCMAEFSRSEFHAANVDSHICVYHEAKISKQVGKRRCVCGRLQLKSNYPQHADTHFTETTPSHPLPCMMWIVWSALKNSPFSSLLDCGVLHQAWRKNQ